MSVPVLICGSIAFDTIMVFPDRFANHILTGHTHILSVAFEVSELRREFGGCAGNIAYTLKLLGGEPVVMGAIGEDGDLYWKRFDKLGIVTDGVRTIPGTYTAQAYITTDLDDNQITAFHPGAMNHSHEVRVDQVRRVELAIVAPDGRAGMIAHCEQLHAAEVPFMFDPGQGLPLFSREELVHLIGLAHYVALNEYEAEMLQKRTGLSMSALAASLSERNGALIITAGAKGSSIYAGDKTYTIGTVPSTIEVDPTGCGDAYRAGLLYGIAAGWDWNKAGNLAALLGSIKVASRGAQNHSFTRETLGELYSRHFKAPLWDV